LIQNIINHAQNNTSEFAKWAVSAWHHTPLSTVSPEFDFGWKRWKDVGGLMSLSGMYPLPQAYPLDCPEIGTSGWPYTQKNNTLEFGRKSINNIANYMT